VEETVEQATCRDILEAIPHDRSVISRAYIHVAGPPGAGKTTLIETFLQTSTFSVLVARGRRDDRLRRSRETSPRADDELRRYRRAGATGAAVFTFPPNEASLDDFFETDLMQNYSEAVVIEGDAPPRFGEVTVYVAPPLPDETSLFVRVQRDRAAEERARVTALRRLLEQRGGMRQFVAEVIGAEFGDAVRNRPALLNDARAMLTAALARAETTPPPAATEHWAIRPEYNGIEHAGVVVVNVRRSDDLGSAARLLDDLGRLRRDRALFDDVFGWRGSRVPITAVKADLSNPRDPGTRKVLARLRRTVRVAADLDSARDID
jgi:hypothetical protein